MEKIASVGGKADAMAVHSDATMSNSDKAFQLVVGYDFSEQSKLALEQALAQCGLHASNVVHVLGVLDSRKGLGAFGSDGKVDFDTAEACQKEIDDEVRARIDAIGGTSISHFVHTRIGNPAKELIALADETGADLIVVGTHGRTGVSRLIMGSVAEQVVRNGTCPVLVVRPSQHPSQDIPEALQPEPPCPMCVQRRTETQGKEWWCEEHSKKHNAPHPVTRQPGQHVPGAVDAWSRFNR